jgi:hypothetical protein
MNAQQIHAKIYAGRAKAALRLGLDYNVFRPISAADPLTNQVATIKAAFNAGDNSYKSPNMPGDPFWYGDFDGRVTQAGDYLVHPDSPLDIKYIAAQQLLLPIICIDCNRTIRVTRTQAQSAVGATGYSGACDHVDADVLGSATGNTGWPASVLFGGRAEIGANLPGSVKQAGWRIMLPPSTPAVVHHADILTDDLGRRYVVQASEQSDIGWRIQATEMHT